MAFGGTSLNNAFPYSRPSSLAVHRSPGVSASSVLNNNGIAQVGLLENICPFPRPSFCRDSFGLPHNDASRLWSSHSRVHERGKGRATVPCRAVPRLHRVASPSVLSSSGGLIVALTFASRVSTRLCWNVVT